MKDTRFCIAVLVFLTALAPAADKAADSRNWPQFKRDAQRSGDNADAALEFPLRRVTAIRFPAPIYASPAVVDGMVYIQDSRGHVACIDAEKNKTVWATRHGGFNNMSSPAVAGGKVFVGSTAGYLAILDAASGKLIKKIPAEGGVISAPAVVDQSVYFSTFNGKLLKIDFEGNIVWTFDGGRMSMTETAVKDKEILFFAGSGNTICYHLRDEGKEVKVLAKAPAPNACVPLGGPTFGPENTFSFQSFDSEFGRFYQSPLEVPLGKGSTTAGDVNDSRVTPSVRGAFVYRGDKCFKGGKELKLAWRADPTILYDGGSHSSPALGKSVLAVGSEIGNVYFFDLEAKETVRKPVFQFQTEGAGKPNGAVSSSPALVDGKVYFGGEDGILYGLGKGSEAVVVDLPPVEGKLGEGHQILKGLEWTTPGGDMGYSYVSEDRELTPPFRIQWKSRVWSSYKGPMIVADSKVFCCGRGGPLTALDAATGEILWKTHHPGVESRPSGTFADGKLLLMRVRCGQGDSPFVVGASGGPAGEGLWCQDAATGKTLWHQPMTFRYHFNTDGLAVHQGKVFVAQLDKEDNLQAVAYALDTGKEVWRVKLTTLADLKGEVKPHPDVKSVPKGLKLPPRFSGVMSSGLWCVSLSDYLTAGLDPSTGKIVWQTRESYISNRSRVAARKDVLVVFSDRGDHALDARTGKLLWKNANKNMYAQALSDLYLESEGKKDIHLSGRCWWPILCNDVWYSHSPSSSNNKLIATRGKVVWSFDFLSNACPSPSPAYGRLYYSPCSEGVIYCFVNEKK